MGYFRQDNGNFRGYFVSLWGLWRDMKLSRVNANLLCVGNIAFGCFSSTSKAVFYIKHNIRNVQDDKERLETKRNCIKRSEFTFENQLFPVVLPTSGFWWELVVVQLGRTTWKRGDAQNGCAVHKIADLVLELVLVVDANILYSLLRAGLSILFPNFDQNNIDAENRTINVTKSV